MSLAEVAEYCVDPYKSLSLMHTFFTLTILVLVFSCQSKGI